mgnify:FL=1
MNTHPASSAAELTEQAAKNADTAIRSTQRLANQSLENLAEKVQDLRDQTIPLLNRVASEAEALARRGLDSVRDTSAQLRDRAAKVSDNTVGYIKDEPMKSMLIAAATGAALMALVSLVTRNRDE